MKIITYEKENSLNHNEQQMHNLNTLYPECSMENSVIYVNCTQNSDKEQKEDIFENEKLKNLSIEKCDGIAQINDEDMVVDDVIAQNIVVNSSADECLNNKNKTEEMTVSLDVENVSEVAAVQQVPDREIIDSDNSEVYLTPTKINDSEKKINIETLIKTESVEDIKKFKSLSEEETENLIYQCNGYIDQKNIEDIDNKNEVDLKDNEENYNKNEILHTIFKKSFEENTSIDSTVESMHEIKDEENTNIDSTVESIHEIKDEEKSDIKIENEDSLNIKLITENSESHSSDQNLVMDSVNDDENNKNQTYLNSISEIEIHHEEYQKSEELNKFEPYECCTIPPVHVEGSEGTLFSLFFRYIDTLKQIQ